MTTAPTRADAEGRMFADLVRLLGEGAGGDPVSQRLFPRAYLDPTEERLLLRWHGDAAVDHGAAERHVAAIMGRITSSGARPLARSRTDRTASARAFSVPALSPTCHSKTMLLGAFSWSWGAPGWVAFIIVTNAAPPDRPDRPSTLLR